MINNWIYDPIMINYLKNYYWVHHKFQICENGVGVCYTLTTTILSILVSLSKVGKWSTHILMMYLKLGYLFTYTFQSFVKINSPKSITKIIIKSTNIFSKLMFWLKLTEFTIFCYHASVFKQPNATRSKQKAINLATWRTLENVILKDLLWHNLIYLQLWGKILRICVT